MNYFGVKVFKQRRVQLIQNIVSYEVLEDLVYCLLKLKILMRKVNSDCSYHISTVTTSAVFVLFFLKRKKKEHDFGRTMEETLLNFPYLIQGSLRQEAQAVSGDQ